MVLQTHNYRLLTSQFFVCVCVHAHACVCVCVHACIHYSVSLCEQKMISCNFQLFLIYDGNMEFYTGADPGFLSIGPKERGSIVTGRGRVCEEKFLKVSLAALGAPWWELPILIICVTCLK